MTRILILYEESSQVYTRLIIQSPLSQVVVEFTIRLKNHLESPDSFKLTSSHLIQKELSFELTAIPSCG